MRFTVIKELTPEHKIVENNVFYYIPWGKEGHGRISFITWINRKLINEEGKIIFPLYGKLIKTEKGNLVIRPDEEEKCWIFPVQARCGFRGSSIIELLSPPDAQLLKYYIYSSPRGNLGISEGALVITPKFPVKFHIKYTGRLYGDPPREFVIIEDTNLNPVISSENLDDIKDLL